MSKQMTRNEALNNVVAAADTFYNIYLDKRDQEEVNNLQESFKIVEKLGARLTRKK